MRARVLNYLPAALLCAIIFANVNLGYYLRKALVERFGDAVFNAIYVVLAAAALFDIVVIFQSREKRALRIILLACLIATLLRSLVTIKYGVDKVHYFEYGLLGALAFAAFTKDFRLPAALFLSVLFLSFAGLVDESIQYFTPVRVAEISDVLLDVKAGVFGLFFVLLFRPPPFFQMTFSKGEARIVTAGLFLAVAGTFLFLEQVHGYGYRIQEPGSYALYSGFRAGELSLVDLQLKQGAAVGPSIRMDYDNEARRHLFQRDFYLKNRFYFNPGDSGRYYIEYGKSFRENAILEKYYGFYLDSASARWDRATQALVDRAQWPDTAWNSRVKETVITRFSRMTVRCVFAGLMLLSAIVAIMAFRGRRR